MAARRNGPRTATGSVVTTPVVALPVLMEPAPLAVLGPDPDGNPAGGEGGSLAGSFQLELGSLLGIPPGGTVAETGKETAPDGGGNSDQDQPCKYLTGAPQVIWAPPPPIEIKPPLALPGDPPVPDQPEGPDSGPVWIPAAEIRSPETGRSDWKPNSAVPSPEATRKRAPEAGPGISIPVMEAPPEHWQQAARAGDRGSESRAETPAPLVAGRPDAFPTPAETARQAGEAAPAMAISPGEPKRKVELAFALRLRETPGSSDPGGALEPSVRRSAPPAVPLAQSALPGREGAPASPAQWGEEAGRVKSENGALPASKAQPAGTESASAVRPQPVCGTEEAVRVKSENGALPGSKTQPAETENASAVRPPREAEPATQRLDEAPRRPRRIEKAEMNPGPGRPESAQGGEPPAQPARPTAAQVPGPHPVETARRVPEPAGAPGQPSPARPEQVRGPELAPELSRIERPRVEPVRDISLSLPADKAESGRTRGIDVRFLERGGEVYVAVRTGDADLAGRLRSDLKSLAARFDEQGVQVQSWNPAASAGPSTGDERPGEQRDRSFAGGGGAGDHTQDSGQGRHSRNRPAWLEALEEQEGERA